VRILVEITEETDKSFTLVSVLTLWQYLWAPLSHNLLILHAALLSQTYSAQFTSDWSFPKTHGLPRSLTIIVLDSPICMVGLGIYISAKAIVNWFVRKKLEFKCFGKSCVLWWI